MTLSHQFVTSSSVNSVSSGETVYRSSECTDPAGRWLVDSGATSHIIGRQHLQCYTVVHEYEDVRCELRAANNSLIETYGVVDVRVRFKGDNGRAKQRVLSKCIVADIPFNVMSPYVLVHNGWECVLSDGRRSFLRFSVPGGTDVEIPLHVKERAWWAQAVVEGPEKPSKKGKGRGSQAMDVDEGRTFRKPDKEGSDPESGLVVTVDQRRVELGSLSFLLRGFESTVHQMSEEFLECEDVRAEGAVRDSNLPEEDHELPPFGEEPVDEAVSGDAELGEVDVELQKYEHLARGHQPYLSSCSTCARAKGKIPARKLVHKRGAYEVASDYGFLGTVRFFVMIVLCTGMIGTFVMDTDMDKNVRSLNNVFREVGLVGKSLEVTLDGEGHLRGLFQRAVRQTNCPVSGVSFVPTPPGRHQTNGKAERAIETIKSGLGANLLFLEERIQRKIPFTSELIRHLLPYVGRTHNMFHLARTVLWIA